MTTVKLMMETWNQFIKQPPEHSNKSKQFFPQHVAVHNK